MSQASLEKKIGFKFKNPDLLKESLTHRSYLNENPRWGKHNERLEFLGDAVFELITSEFLYHKYPEQDEGYLTALRAALINYQRLALVAQEIGLGNYIYLSRGEAKDTGKAREVILANGMESLLAAIYLDQGYDSAKKFVEKFLLPHLDEIIKKQLYKDPKSLLQEIVQEKLKITPIYKVLEENGPDHQKVFKVGVFFNDKLAAVGDGSSKQEGEISAAEHALSSIKF